MYNAQRAPLGQGCLGQRKIISKGEKTSHVQQFNIHLNLVTRCLLVWRQEDDLRTLGGLERLAGYFQANGENYHYLLELVDATRKKSMGGYERGDLTYGQLPNIPIFHIGSYHIEPSARDQQTEISIVLTSGIEVKVPQHLPGRNTMPYNYYCYTPNITKSNDSCPY